MEAIILKLINSDNKIFSSIEFQKDKYKFYLISLNLKSESVMLYSDEENYVICRGAEGLPTLIWTKDEFNVSKIEEIISAMNLYLTDADSQNVKPGIVIGRIQKDIDDYSFMAQYRERYKWSS